MIQNSNQNSRSKTIFLHAIVRCQSLLIIAAKVKLASRLFTTSLCTNFAQLRAHLSEKWIPNRPN